MDNNLVNLDGNADSAAPNQADSPVDPSNTSHIGQPNEQGIVAKNEGISEQSATWEHETEKAIPGEGDNSIEERVEHYLKHPSPEDMSETD